MLVLVMMLVLVLVLVELLIVLLLEFQATEMKNLKKQCENMRSILMNKVRLLPSPGLSCPAFHPSTGRGDHEDEERPSHRAEEGRGERGQVGCICKSIRFFL